MYSPLEPWKLDELDGRILPSFFYSYGPLPVISTYNPIYRMYNPTYNQL